MKDCSTIVDVVITNLKSEMGLMDKHVIKTKTLWERTLHIIALSDSTVHYQLEKEGLAQVIERRLHARGYRSVRTGYFVNFDECTDIQYLQAIYENAENSASERKAAANQLRKYLDGQGYFTNKDLDYEFPMCEEEFMKKLEEDAV